MKQSTTHSERRNFWKTQLALASKFPGSRAEYCKANNLAYTTFCYWHNKLSDEAKSIPAVVSKPFVQVAVEKVHSVSRRSSLPDAKWVAELILHLQGGGQ